MATVRWLAMVLAVVAVAVLLGYGAVAALRVPQSPTFHPAVRVLGAAVAAGGVALAAWTFRHHPARLMAAVTERTIEIVTKRLDPSATVVPRLITTGPYRVVRNPTYLSVFLVLVGLALAAPAWALLVAAGVLLAWWRLLVIPPEERELAAKFGDDYAAYRARTGRFLPRLR